MFYLQPYNGRNRDHTIDLIETADTIRKIKKVEEEVSKDLYGMEARFTKTQAAIWHSTVYSP